MDKELVISKLTELGNYFSDRKVTFDYFITRVNNYGYTEDLVEHINNFVLDIFKESEYNTEAELLDKIKFLYEYKSKIFYNEEKNAYKIIPFEASDDDPVLVKGNEKVVSSVLDEFFKGKLPFKDVVQKYIDKYNSKVSILRQLLIENKLEPYYGSSDYMIDRMNFIRECINKVMISDRVNDSLKPIFAEQFGKINELFDDLEKKVNSNEFERNSYLDIEKIYIKVLEIENSLTPYMQPIWDEYLTKPEDYVPGEEYHFLIHTAKSFVDEDKLTKVCTTLATDKCTPIPNNSDYGFVMNMSMDQISSMSSIDSGSWVISKYDFVDKLNNNWQYAEPIDDKHCIYYEEPLISKLMLPWDIEEKMINNNKKSSGNYSEIVMVPNGKPLKIDGYFAISDLGMKKVEEENNTMVKPKPVVDFKNVYEKNYHRSL